jgi:hypothetical protein
MLGSMQIVVGLDESTKETAVQVIHPFLDTDEN